MFGGIGATTTLDDTWIWDGAAWTQQQTDAGPPARAAATSAANHQEVVLFGGQDPNGVLLGDTWTWNGTSWTRLNIAGPSPRMGSMMAGLGF